MASAMDSRKLFRTAALILLGSSVIWLGVQAWQIYNLASDLREQASTLTRYAGLDPAAIDLQAVQSDISRAHETAESLQQRLRPFAPILQGLGWIPRLGPLLRSAKPAVDYAAGLTSAADDLLQLLMPLIAPGASTGGSPGEALLLALETGQDHIRSAQDSMQQAISARSMISLEVLPEGLKGPLARLDPLLPAASSLIQALEHLPWALGADQPRTYLLLAQNSDELRATGGFISGAGTFEIEAGAVANLKLGDSYALDDLSQPYPPPPEPMQHFLNAGLWLLRDANWSPDFPTSAEQAMALYRLSSGRSTDGVIAFDQLAVQRLLATVGPVTLDEFDEPITAENVLTYMHLSWGGTLDGESEPGWWQQRKDFMGHLGRALLDRALAAGDAQALLGLIQTGYKLLREKHLLVYFTLEELQAALHAARLDGGLQPGGGDFLALIDSNLGFNKVDPLIDRRLEYRVDLSQPGRPTASVLITYHSTIQAQVQCRHGAFVESSTYTDLQQRCYWDYYRIYVPGGVEPISSQAPAVPAAWLLTGEAQPGEIQFTDAENGTSVFSGLFVLPTERTVQIELAYLLPSSILTETNGSLTYTLELFKQPGTQGTPFMISIQPPRRTIPEAGSGFEQDSDGRLKLEGRLYTDQSFQIQFRPGGEEE